jgi:hypothetical protein
VRALQGAKGRGQRRRLLQGARLGPRQEARVGRDALLLMAEDEAEAEAEARPLQAEGAVPMEPETQHGAHIDSDDR